MTGSSARLRRLGAELRRLREAAGRTQTEVGRAIGRTHATLVNWERGKTKISKADLAYLLAELRAPVDVRKSLEDLREETGQHGGWWSTYGLTDWLRPFVSFEADAVQIDTFQPVIIPGLLQTDAYIRAIHDANPYAAPRQGSEPWVQARIERQRRLSEPDPLRLRAVIAEAALRLAIGGLETLRGQLERLLRAAQQDNITLHVVPDEAGAHPALASNFSILHFADPAVDPPLGYFDGPLGGYMVDDPGDVATLANMFNDLEATALTSEGSTGLIARLCGSDK